MIYLRLFIGKLLLVSCCLTSIAFADEEKEAKEFVKKLEAAFGSRNTKKLRLNFFKKEQEELFGECAKKTIRKQKEEYSYNDEKNLVLINKTRFGKTNFFYGIGEDFDGTPESMSGGVEGEKYTPAYLDSNDDLVQDTFAVYAPGQVDYYHFEHTGRTYLRSGTFEGKKTLLYVHKVKTVKDTGLSQEQTSTSEVYCYFKSK